MVDHAGRYYGAAFKGLWGVTKGYPLSPTIFNLEMDAVVQHWALLVEERTGGQDRCGREVQHRGAFFVQIMAC